MSRRVYARKFRALMWERGMPMTDDRFVDVYRAALRAGLTDGQATALVTEAYNAAKHYVWELAEGRPLHFHTVKANAERHPNGKCAEELRAAAEGRPSRWGTPEFHAAARAAS